MACIRKEILVDAHPDRVWEAVRDFGAVHQRLAQGFVIDTRLEGDARVVTFSNGSIVRELLVDLDDRNRRIAYAAVGGQATHHNASLQVFADGKNRSRLLWITDVLPDSLSRPIGLLVEQGTKAMKQTLERREETG